MTAWYAQKDVFGMPATEAFLKLLAQSIKPLVELCNNTFQEFAKKVDWPPTDGIWPKLDDKIKDLRKAINSTEYWAPCSPSPSPSPSPGGGGGGGKGGSSVVSTVVIIATIALGFVASFVAVACYRAKRARARAQDAPRNSDLTRDDLDAQRNSELTRDVDARHDGALGGSAAGVSLLDSRMEAQSSSGRSSSAGQILLNRIEVVPYGVLGQQQGDQGKVSMAAEPGPDTVVLDPAGLTYIQGRPGGASGAAGEIYRWLGIDDDPAFPEPVTLAIDEPLKVKFHSYGDKKCLHAVGPDFRGRNLTRDEAVDELRIVYGRVFQEFVATGLRRLRLLPLSGGIFSGNFVQDLPAMTAEALSVAFSSLGASQREAVLQAASLEMCIYMEKDLQAYKQAISPSAVQAEREPSVME